MTVTDADLKRGAPPAASVPRHVKGLLWREWLAHRAIAVGAAAIYLTLAWALLIFFHPGFVLGYGLILVLVVGPALAAQEPLEGSEEFAFSLPPTRGERYLVRLALWGGGFLLFLVFATLSIAFDLPQLVWGLFVQTGFTEANPKADAWLYGLAVAMPFAAFAFTFVFGGLARTRGAAMWSAFLGVLCAAAIFFLWAAMNALIGVDAFSWTSVPVLLVFAAGALVLGYFGYVRKEGISRPASMSGSRGWGWALLIVGVLLALLFLTSIAHIA